MPVVPHQRPVEARLAVGPVGDEQQPAGADGEGAEVERLVVQRAQRQAVALESSQFRRAGATANNPPGCERVAAGGGWASST